jgi:hypothetical protein
MDGFLNLYNTCASMNSNSPREVAALLGDVNELVDNDHCIIETSNIHSASITASNSRPIDIREQNGGGNTCIDDDAFIQSAFSNPDLGCGQVAGQGLCPMLADSGIENRAPPPSPLIHRARLFSFVLLPAATTPLTETVLCIRRLLRLLQRPPPQHGRGCQWCRPLPDKHGHLPRPGRMPDTALR